ncbi:hypothetical protein BDW66DRAFT_124156 [Aspergillus desertorum]
MAAREREPKCANRPWPLDPIAFLSLDYRKGGPSIVHVCLSSASGASHTTSFS